MDHVLRCHIDFASFTASRFQAFALAESNHSFQGTGHSSGLQVQCHKCSPQRPPIQPEAVRLPAPKEASAGRITAIIIHTRPKWSKSVVFSSYPFSTGYTLVSISQWSLVQTSNQFTQCAAKYLPFPQFPSPSSAALRDANYTAAPSVEHTNPLKYNGATQTISFAFKISPMHSFSLFCPLYISGFRASYPALPSILQNQTKSIFNCIYIGDAGFPLWMATS